MSFKVKPLLLLFLAQGCVGINIVLSKGLVDHINPLIIMTIRFSLASLFMSLLLLRSDEIQKLNFRLSLMDWLVLLAKGVGAGLFFNLLMLRGLHFTNANSAGLITSLLPAIVICLNIFLFKQKLNKNILIAIMISIAGLIFINLEAFGAHSKNALLGNFFIFLALLPEGLYYTLSKYCPTSKVPPITNAILLNILNLPFLCMMIVFIPISAWHNITWHDGMVLAIIGLATGFFFLCWQRGIEYVDAAYTALATAFMPLTTVILAWILLGEVLTPIKFIGMLFVIVSILYYAKSQKT